MKVNAYESYLGVIIPEGITIEPSCLTKGHWLYQKGKLATLGKVTPLENGWAAKKGHHENLGIFPTAAKAVYAVLKANRAERA